MLLRHFGCALQSYGNFLLSRHVNILGPAGIGVFLLVAAAPNKGEGHNGQADKDAYPPTSSFHDVSVIATGRYKKTLIAIRG